MNLQFSFNFDKYRTRANKGRGFYSKNIFSALHNGAFSQNFVYICCTQLHKIVQNAPIFGIVQGAATIQERPLLTWVQNFVFYSKSSRGTVLFLCPKLIYFRCFSES